MASFKDLISFLSSYPVWVKGLVAAWVVLTGMGAAVLVFTHPAREADKQKTLSGVWLKIKNVETFSSEWSDAGVRVTADVNGNSFVYPSIGGVQWVMMGPDMAAGLYKLPDSEIFPINFSMMAKHQGKDDTMKFVSQKSVVVQKSDLPFSQTYPLFQLGSELMRGGAIKAQVSFSISGDPS
jgi:hypothetical protein